MKGITPVIGIIILIIIIVSMGSAAYNFISGSFESYSENTIKVVQGSGRDNEFIIQNLGTKPLDTNDLVIEINGEFGAIQPAFFQTIEPGKSARIVFDSPIGGNSKVRVLGPSNVASYNVRIETVNPPDFQGPVLTFTPPTLDNGTATGEYWIYVNVSANESLSRCFLEHNESGILNQSMAVGGDYCYFNKTGLLNNTTLYFRVYGNDTSDNWGVTEDRAITSAAPIPNQMNQSVCIFDYTPIIDCSDLIPGDGTNLCVDGYVLGNDYNTSVDLGPGVTGIQSLEFELYFTTCSSTQLNLLVNGVIVGNSSLRSDCVCSPPLYPEVVTITNQTLLDSVWNFLGSNIILIDSPGNYYIAGHKVMINYTV